MACNMFGISAIGMHSLIFYPKYHSLNVLQVFLNKTPKLQAFACVFKSSSNLELFFVALELGKLQELANQDIERRLDEVK